MATTTSVPLGTLIDNALWHLYRTSERPGQVSLAGTMSASATSFTLSSQADWDKVNATDVLEFGCELLLITAKSTDDTPVFTCQRGYLGTTSQAHSAGAVGLLNPQFPRLKVRKAVLMAFGPMLVWLPNKTTTAIYRVAGKRRAIVPADAIDVVDVRFEVTTNGSIEPIGGWFFEEDLPTSVSSTTKALRLPVQVTDTDQLLVTYTTGFYWSGGGLEPADGVAGESETVDIQLGAQDLPSVYAAAYLVTGREIGRMELDRIDEWNKEAAIRGGVNLQTARQLWTDFYRRLDEARRLPNNKKRRPYMKMRKGV